MEKKVVVKIKKASFYKAFGKSLNLMRPVGEFTKEEVEKLSDDIKKGLIEIVGEEPAQDLSQENKKEEEIKTKEITEEVVENEQPVEETKTEEVKERQVEKEAKARGKKAN